MMQDIIKRIDFVFDGFFYFFGFLENPADKKAQEIIDVTPSEKIKADLKKVNRDYRKNYEKMRKEVYCLE